LFSLYATGTFNADYHRTSTKNGGMVVCAFSLSTMCGKSNVIAISVIASPTPSWVGLGRANLDRIYQSSGLEVPCLYPVPVFSADYHRTSMKNGGMVICDFLVYPVLIYNELAINSDGRNSEVRCNVYRTTTRHQCIT